MFSDVLKQQRRSADRRGGARRDPGNTVAIMAAPLRLGEKSCAPDRSSRIYAASLDGEAKTSWRAAV